MLKKSIYLTLIIFILLSIKTIGISAENNYNLIPSWSKLSFEIKFKRIVNTVGKEKLESTISKLAQTQINFNDYIKQLQKIGGFNIFNDLQTIIGCVSDYTNKPDYMVTLVGNFPITSLVEAVKSGMKANINIERGYTIINIADKVPMDIILFSDRIISICTHKITNKVISLLEQREGSVLKEHATNELITSISKSNDAWVVAKIDETLKKDMQNDDGLETFKKISYITFGIQINSNTALCNAKLICDTGETASTLKSMLETYRMIASSFVTQFKTVSQLLQNIKMEVIENYLELNVSISEEQLNNIQNELKNVPKKKVPEPDTNTYED